MPKKVLHQIKYLCKKIAAVEWSGVLFYGVDGSIKDPKNLTLTLQDILPMHKGTAAYTEYTFDERVVNHMMTTPESDNWKMGHIHSHNNMDVYFSGTDMSELEDNSPNHNFYLSLIVNNKMEFCAKVAFLVKTDSKEFPFIAKDENGQKYTYSNESLEQTKLITYDCEIICSENKLDVESSFEEKVKGIIKDSEKKLFSNCNWSSNLISSKTRRYGVKINWDEKYSDNSWNNWGESHSTITPTNWGESYSSSYSDVMTHEEELEKEEQVLKDFAIYVLNVGNTTYNFKKITDVLENHLATFTTAKQLSSRILKKYLNLYKNFFSNVKEKDTPSMFEEMTEGIIEVMDVEKYSSNSVYNRGVLEAVTKVLENMLNKFKKYEPNTIK